jgi:two-component system response regulator QseB
VKRDVRKSLGLDGRLGGHQTPLTQLGYEHALVFNVGQATNLSHGGGFDLMILDLGLPDKDGMVLLNKLRGQGLGQPIILLTARDDIHDKGNGFELGADNFVTKPFRFEDLLARVKARLRNAQPTNSKDNILTIGPIVLARLTRRVQVAGKPVDLSAREFTLAETLMRHAGQVLSRQQLLDLVWGYDYDPESHIVDV